MAHSKLKLQNSKSSFFFLYLDGVEVCIMKLNSF